jgi:hypothetical protein
MSCLLYPPLMDLFTRRPSNTTHDDLYNVRAVRDTSHAILAFNSITPQLKITHAYNGLSPEVGLPANGYDLDFNGNFWLGFTSVQMMACT